MWAARELNGFLLRQALVSRPSLPLSGGREDSRAHAPERLATERHPDHAAH